MQYLTPVGGGGDLTGVLQPCGLPSTIYFDGCLATFNRAQQQKNTKPLYLNIFTDLKLKKICWLLMYLHKYFMQTDKKTFNTREY